MNFSEIAHKKVAGIPVLYLGAAFVVILALVAWKLPTSGGDSGSDTKTQPEEPGQTGGGAAEDYSSLATTGTVTVVQSPVAPPEATTPTNEQWARAAIDYLITSNLATPSEAQAAITHYLEGGDLTYAEGKLKDEAIRKLKLPPEPLSGLGKVDIAPAQRQGSHYPVKHTVKNANDNSFAKLANLYYGRSDEKYTASIASRNTNLARYGYFDPGTVVIVPGYTEPQFYTAGSQDAKTIAAKASLSVDALKVLNPGMVFPVKKGTKVRVR